MSLLLRVELLTLSGIPTLWWLVLVRRFDTQWSQLDWRNAMYSGIGGNFSTTFALRQVGHCCFVPFIAPPPEGKPLHSGDVSRFTAFVASQRYIRACSCSAWWAGRQLILREESSP